MAYLGRARKEELKQLAFELGLDVEEEMKVNDLCRLISKDKDYDEDFTKNQLETIIEDRKLREKQEAEMQSQQKEHEFQLEKIRLENEKFKITPSGSEVKASACELTKIVPKFEMKDGDIVLFLTLFERQAKRINIEKSSWVSALLALMPSEINQLIVRESEEKFDNYDYIKDLLLKRFKLNSEHFRQKFVKQQRNPSRSWRDFVFEITSYFEEWIEGVGVNDFEGLKNLIITDQLKRRVPFEIREHFVDDWAKLIIPGTLADKLDEYESVRSNSKTFIPSDTKQRPTNNYRPKVPVLNNNNYKRKEEPPFRKFKTPYTPKTDRNNSFKPTCFTCGTLGHLSRVCPQNLRKTPVSNATSNVVEVKESKPEKVVELVTAKVSVPVSTPLTARDSIDDLKFAAIKCGGRTLHAVIDSGAQISVVREDLVDIESGEGEGTIQIISAFGEKEVTALKLFDLKVDDSMQCSVPIMCAVSKKLVNDMLISSTAYELLLGNSESSNLESHANFDNPAGKDIPSNDFLVDKKEADVSDTSMSIKNLKTSTFFCDKCTVVENGTLSMQGANNMLSDFMDDIPKVVCQDLTKNCVAFSQNIKSLVLNSVVEDKISIPEETAILADDVSCNLVSVICDKNIDSSESNEVNLNLSRSETKFEKENPSKENQKSSSQINKLNLNVASETLEAELNNSDSLNANEVTRATPEKEILLIEENSPDRNQVSSSTVESKMCPKLKIFKKTDVDSLHSLKNWFVLENSEAEITSSIISEVFEAKPDDKNSANFIAKSDLNVSFNLTDNNCAVSETENDKSVCEKSNIDVNLSTHGIQPSSKHDSLSDVVTCYVMSIEKTNNSLCNFDVNSSTEKALIETDKVSSEDQSAGESYGSSSEKNSLPRDKVATVKNNESTNENVSIFDHEESSKKSLSEKENDHMHSVVKQEEPIYIDENSKCYDSANLEQTNVDLVPILNKRRRGRHRRSMESEPILNKRRHGRHRRSIAWGPIPNKRKHGRLRRSIERGPIPNKRKRGRLRKSVQRNNPILDFDEVIPKREKTSIQVFLKVEDEDVVASQREIKEILAGQPKGRKRNVNPTLVSTSSSVLRKKYDSDSINIPLKLSNVSYILKEKPIYRVQFEIGKSDEKSTKRVCTSPNIKKNSKMPSIYTPGLERPFQLSKDASATAIGACLAQNNDKKEKIPTAFSSKKLSPTQIKFSTIEREAFCVLESLWKFDTWIFGSEIQVISDHDPLTYLTKSAPHSAKLTRWSLALQRYNVNISYRKGSAHGNADALSRLRTSD